MKRIIYFIVLALSFSSCEKIKETDLPDAARTFISSYFPEENFSHGKKNKDDGTITYDVTLSNGVELEFSQSGDWICVDCRYSFMLDGILSLIPQNIILYFAEKHPNSRIMKIEKEMGGFEININSPTGDFDFNSNGHFIRYDP